MWRQQYRGRKLTDSQEGRLGEAMSAPLATDKQEIGPFAAETASRAMSDAGIGQVITSAERYNI